mgnify:CR=1 FL=1
MNDRFPLIGSDWSDEDPYCGALLIPVDLQGRLLLQLRDHGPNTVHPGKWGLFGGGVEGDESPHDAVVREFAEEAGITIPPDAPCPFGRVLSTPGRRRLYVFSATLDISPSDITLGEGAGFGFIQREDLPGLNLVPFARLVLETFLASR